MEHIRTLEVAGVNPKTGGGALRAVAMLSHRRVTGIDCRSIFLDYDPSSLKRVVASCPPQALVQTRRLIDLAPLPSSLKLSLTLHTLLFSTKALAFKVEHRPHLVISHHDPINALRATLKLAEELEAPSLAILQLPPIYGDRRRIERLEASVDLFYELLRASYLNPRDYIGYIYSRSIWKGWNKLFYGLTERLLRRFDALLAASPSIPLEMGDEWINRVVSLKPGYGFEEGELEILRSYRGESRAESRYAIFPARLAIQKGLADLLLATKLIIREYSGFKLLVLGSGHPKIRRYLERIASKLGLKDNIVMLDYMPRFESFAVRSKAKLTLYPSHYDSYSYSVAEQLLMGVPVVAYDIPALKLNYAGVDGLYLVPEGDIEALAQKALELLKARRVEVGVPRVKLNKHVALEEKAAIEKVVERKGVAV